MNFHQKISNANVSILTLNDHAPFSSEVKVPYNAVNTQLLIKIPAIDYEEFILRKAIKITVSSDNSEICFASFKIL